MKHLLPVFFLISLLGNCQPTDPVHDPYESENLKIQRIGTNVFQHTSYLNTRTMGKVACNGMVYMNGDEAIIFDTPTSNEASAELINWVGEKEIKAVVVTHFHVDCLGGLRAFHDKGISSYASEKTVSLATQAGKDPLPQHGFDEEQKFRIGEETVLAKYFGQGHTHDNIVGYVKREEALFGGCLIKSTDASKGNLADANVAEWSATVEKIRKEFPDLKIVIPGHGSHGNTDLLTYTERLFENDRPVVFFLHNRWAETHTLEEGHPQYGVYEYQKILERFEDSGLKVISEKRRGNVNAREYAMRVAAQIDSLIAKGMKPANITVAGTSKGGYIAQYVSTIANDPRLNFAFIASFQDSDIERIPDINFCGNILTIYEKSDPLGVSAERRRQLSSCEIVNFKEIELNTGMGHGFLFKPMKEWTEPVIQWAKENSEMAR